MLIARGLLALTQPTFVDGLQAHVGGEYGEKPPAVVADLIKAQGYLEKVAGLEGATVEIQARLTELCWGAVGVATFIRGRISALPEGVQDAARRMTGIRGRSPEEIAEASQLAFGDPNALGQFSESVGAQAIGFVDAGFLVALSQNLPGEVEGLGEVTLQNEQWEIREGIMRSLELREEDDSITSLDDCKKYHVKSALVVPVLQAALAVREAAEGERQALAEGLAVILNASLTGRVIGAGVREVFPSDPGGQREFRLISLTKASLTPFSAEEASSGESIETLIRQNLRHLERRFGIGAVGEETAEG